MKKRQDISQLTRNRSIYFKVALIVSLSFTILAFNYTVYEVSVVTFEVEPVDDIMLPEIIRTKHEKPPVLPPPAIDETENIVEAEEVEFTEEPEPEITDQPILDKQPKVVVEAPPAPAKKKTPAPLIEPLIEEKVEKPIFVIVEEMPRFGDCHDDNLSKDEKRICSDRAFLSYIYKHIKYPAIAKENGIEGPVYLQFIIDEKGKVTNAEVVKDIGGGCGAEALRVIKKMPNWSPGKQRTQAVKVRMTLPVKFVLQ